MESSWCEQLQTREAADLVMLVYNHLCPATKDDLQMLTNLVHLVATGDMTTNQQKPLVDKPKRDVFMADCATWLA